ncbi:MAG: hypothetical protein WC890_04325 [Candidatus Margulisiibacteriota bacterium]
MNNFLFTGFVSIFGAIVTVLALLCTPLKKIFFTFIDSYFDKKLEEHKHALSLITENAKFDYQKKLSDFNLYVQKKHQIYSELFKYIMIADGKVAGLRGCKEFPTFQEYNKMDIEEYLLKLKVPRGKIEDIINIWVADNDLAKKEVRIYLDLAGFNNAKKALIEANNCYWLSVIYLSEAVNNECRPLLDKISSLLTIYEFKEASSEFNKDSKTLKEEIAALISSLTSIMKKELTEPAMR